MAKKKHKHSTLRIFNRPAEPLPFSPEQEGLRAFRAGNFDGALRTWQVITHPSDALKLAMAEAHFRRALLRSTDADRGLDLEHAVRLAPHDPRFLYHQGMLVHRTGDQAGAATRYRAVLEAEPQWSGAAYLLALATVELAPSADLAALPGSTEAIRATLAPIQALLRGHLPPDGPGTLEHFWHGLGLIPAGDGAARAVLEDNRALPAARASAIRRYYRGVAAAQAGDLEAAKRAWQHVSVDPASHQWLYYNQAVALVLDGGRPLDSARLSDSGAESQAIRQAVSSTPALAVTTVLRLDDAARPAAAEKNWAGAVALWELARDLLGATNGLGSPRTLLHNLALAYEALERWPEAADTWRAMLRTRPRTQQTGSAAEYTDAQWAWVRKRVIECYKRSGQPEQAVTLFRQAVKKEPQDLDMRMQFVEALLANDQERAAMAELGRIREVDPGHVEAALRLAMLHAERGEFYLALPVLRDVFARHPARADVRTALVEAFLDYGNDFHRAGMLQRAIVPLQEGWKLVPDDWRFPLYLARVYVDMRQLGRARELLSKAEAQAGNQAQAWALILDCWAATGAFTEARIALGRAEAAISPSADFYARTASIILKYWPSMATVPAREQKRYEGLIDLAVELFERSAAREPENVAVRRDAASSLTLSRSEVAQRFAEEVVRLAPDDASDLSLLGTLQGLNGHVEEARATLRAAIRIARRQHNSRLATQCEELVRLVQDAQALRSRLQMAIALSSLRGIGAEMGMDLDDMGL